MFKPIWILEGMQRKLAMQATKYQLLQVTLKTISFPRYFSNHKYPLFICQASLVKQFLQVPKNSKVW